MTIATCFAEANATEDQIAEELAERDRTLVYHKYTKRKDSREYWRMARKVVQSVESESGGLNDLLELQGQTERPAVNPESTGAELLEAPEVPPAEKSLFLTAKQVETKKSTD